MMIKAASRPFEMRFIGPEDYEALEAEWAIGSPEQPVSTEARQLSARRSDVYGPQYGISELQIASTCMQFTRTGPPEPVTAPHQNQWVGDYGFGVVRQSPVSAPPLLEYGLNH